MCFPGSLLSSHTSFCCMCTSEAQRGQGWPLVTTRMGTTTTDSRPGASQSTESVGGPWSTLGQTGWAPVLAQDGKGH